MPIVLRFFRLAVLLRFPKYDDRASFARSVCERPLGTGPFPVGRRRASRASVGSGGSFYYRTAMESSREPKGIYTKEGHCRSKSKRAGEAEAEGTADRKTRRPPLPEARQISLSARLAQMILFPLEAMALTPALCRED